MEIRTFGTGERINECCRVVKRSEKCIPFCRLFLLPIPTTKDNLTVTGTEIALSEICRETSKGDAVAGYGIPENIKRELVLKDVAIYDGADDEELLLRNAEITSRGALGHLLTEYRRDITDIKIGIVGYGRIGSCLLRYLLYLGAEVTVFTTRDTVARELCEFGVNASSEFDGLMSLDILMNTAPARLLSEKTAREFMERGKIIDLASGKIFTENRNLEKLESIPGKMYPTTSGRVYAEQILKYLVREGDLC